MQTNTGLICGIFESKSIENCSNSGISAKYKNVLVIIPGKNIGPFEEREDMPTVKIVRRIIGGDEYVHAEPVKKGSYMAGGSFIYSCDSRFREYVNEYPISLHDRQETQKEYDLLSR